MFKQKLQFSLSIQTNIYLNAATICSVIFYGPVRCIDCMFLVAFLYISNS